MTAVPPTPEEQVLFLRNIQRLLMEGQFTASYKFALLHAIADLCVLKADDSGAALDLDVKDISEKFIELYWQQCSLTLPQTGVRQLVEELNQSLFPVLGERLNLVLLIALGCLLQPKLSVPPLKVDGRFDGPVNGVD